MAEGGRVSALRRRAKNHADDARHTEKFARDDPAMDPDLAYKFAMHARADWAMAAILALRWLLG